MYLLMADLIYLTNLNFCEVPAVCKAPAVVCLAYASINQFICTVTRM